MKLKNTLIKSPNCLFLINTLVGSPIFEPLSFKYYSKFISDISKVIPIYAETIKNTMKLIFYSLAKNERQEKFQHFFQWNYIYKKRLVVISVVLEKMVQIFEFADDPVDVLESINASKKSKDIVISIFLSDINIVGDVMKCMIHYAKNFISKPSSIKNQLQEYFNICEIEEIYPVNQTELDCLLTTVLNFDINAKNCINKEILNFEQEERERMAVTYVTF